MEHNCRPEEGFEASNMEPEERKGVATGRSCNLFLRSLLGDAIGSIVEEGTAFSWPSGSWNEIVNQKQKILDYNGEQLLLGLPINNLYHMTSWDFKNKKK